MSKKTITEKIEVQEQRVKDSKKWRDYLFDFFMLFLAVYLGFNVENYREELNENKTSKHFVLSLIHDIDKDSLAISDAIMQITYQLRCNDTLIHCLNGVNKKHKIKWYL